MKTHELKTWPGPFSDVSSGRKTYEVRKEDRNYEVGDVLVLREWQPVGQFFTGRAVKMVVVHKTGGGAWGLPAGLCVLGVRVLTNDCTGLTARWCPVHGNCVCDEAANELSDAACPLHNPFAEHGEP